MSPRGRAAAAVGLLIACLAAGCSSSPSFTPNDGPPIAVPGPDERVTLFGTTVYRGAGDFEEALARQDTAYGRLEVARIFYPGGPEPWVGSPADVADRPVVVSFKLPPAEVIAGDHDASLRAWFSSIPRDRRVWWVYFHEPEDNIEDGHFTAEDFRAAFRHIRELSLEVDRPKLRAALVLQCRTTKPEVGRTFEDYDPGSEYFDVMGFDCYNREVRQGSYPDAASWLAPMVEKAQQVGHPLGMAEIGSQLVPGDDGTGRARWLEQVAVELIDLQSPFAVYFDSPITGTDYRLTDAPSRQAWRQILTGTP